MNLGALGDVFNDTGAAPVLAPVAPVPADSAPKLPSSASVLCALRGEPGGWVKVGMSTALRAVLIAPGMALAGARGGGLVWGSLLSSATITAFLFIFDSGREQRVQQTPSS
jgi:hypothetical protein